MQTAIQPVQVFPSTATILFVRAGNLGPPPSFYYALKNAAGDTLKDGNASMTAEQWNAWNNAIPDSQYILSSVAANLGLSLA